MLAKVLTGLARRRHREEITATKKYATLVDAAVDGKLDDSKKSLDRVAADLDELGKTAAEFNRDCKEASVVRSLESKAEQLEPLLAEQKQLAIEQKKDDEELAEVRRRHVQIATKRYERSQEVERAIMASQDALRTLVRNHPHRPLAAKEIIKNEATATRNRVDALDRDIRVVEGKIAHLRDRDEKEVERVKLLRETVPAGPYLPKIPDVAASAVTGGFAQDGTRETVRDLEVRRQGLLARRSAAVAATEFKEKSAATDG